MYLLPGEDVLVEVELDLLIGDVDAELLKRVPLKVFKAEDVQDADVQTLVFLPEEKYKDKIRNFIYILLKMLLLKSCHYFFSAFKQHLTTIYTYCKENTAILT